MKDPALGRTRAQRALGENYNEGVSTRTSRVKEFRMINNGMFSAPRQLIGRYSIAATAMDAVNRARPKDNK